MRRWSDVQAMIFEPADISSVPSDSHVQSRSVLPAATFVNAVIAPVCGLSAFTQ